MPSNREMTFDERIDVCEHDVERMKQLFSTLGDSINTVLADISKRMDAQDTVLVQLQKALQQANVDMSGLGKSIDAAHQKADLLQQAAQQMTSALGQLTMAVTRPPASTT